MIALILLVALPLVEIGVLIKVGGWLGFWPTLAIVVATLVAGGIILARSGITSALRMREALMRGEAPVQALIEGALTVLAGVLLVTPGLIADTIGLLLLVPPIRSAAARLAVRRTLGSAHVEVRRGGFQYEARQPPPNREADGEPRPRGSAPGGPVIEGEFERLDETPVDPRRPGGAGSTGSGPSSSGSKPG